LYERASFLLTGPILARHNIYVVIFKLNLNEIMQQNYVTCGHIVYFCYRCCHAVLRPTRKIGYSEIRVGKYEFTSPMKRSINGD